MEKPTKLCQSNLEAIAAQCHEVIVPKYDRKALRAGILHFGIGHFHRAHQAVYLDRLMNLEESSGGGDASNWAIIGAEVMDQQFIVDRRDMLKKQDFLTTIVSSDEDGTDVRIVGPMVDFLLSHEQIANRLADPAIRIVSMTITEGGYFIDPATGEFNSAHPDIQADAASPDTPKTVFGLIIAGLKRRKLAGHQPFTVLSCDNIPHNGDIARQACVHLAALSDPTLAKWIDKCVTFPNGMVDRITPSSGQKEGQICASNWGILDGWPIFCERFSQWIVEDKFPAGRPALEKVGVQFVPDVGPYVLMKLRILNGGHALIAYSSALLGHRLVHEAIQNPLISGFLRKIMLEEIVPPLVHSSGKKVPELMAYCEQVEKRLQNPQIEDAIQRLCADGSNRQPKFIIPSIEDAIRQGFSFSGLALASALWCRYCFGQTEEGIIKPNDPSWKRLQMQAHKAKENPMEWLEMENIYGELGKSPKFYAAFAQSLEAIWTKGTSKVLHEFLTN